MSVCIAGMIVFAQTATSPVACNWKSVLVWQDPNPVGWVAQWVVCASNTASVRFVTNAPGAQLRLNYQALLTGAAAGTYAIFTIPVDSDGLTGNAGTNHFARWPGGNGRPNGGVALQTTK